jgi:glycosyltransferase involved in cell wall biosynthesis
MVDLSILIPSRNEMFLSRTISDILEHSEADTEIIAVLDGAWTEPPIPDHPKVTLVYHSQSIGQRAATNEAAKLARGKYVMKLDAHCSMAQGFDKVLLADMQDDWTVVPTMRNLHAFDWVCLNGHRRYQGPSGVCTTCGEPTTMDLVWIAKSNPQSNSYCFDTTPHFQYFREWNKRLEGKGDLTETMSLQGSCFMMTKERYFSLNICDESIGSWGSQGIEVSIKSWLSGGQVMVNHKTYYAHMFRTQGGDFGFPYPLSGRQVEEAKTKMRSIIYNDGFPGQIKPLFWLIEHFWPVSFWKDEDLLYLKQSEIINGN